MPNFWRFFFALKRENFKFDIDFHRLKILGKNVLRTNDIPWTPTVGQTHLLTLVVKPDQTYQVLVEGRSIFLEAVFEIHIENVRRICSSDQMKSYFFVRLITFRRLMAAWLMILISWAPGKSKILTRASHPIGFVKNKISDEMIRF